MTLRTALFSLCAALSFLLPAVVAADKPMYFSDGGAAIGGYDTVSYFSDGGPVRGRPDIAVTWKGAVWLFSTVSNREVFESNPRAYAPQYGGYCAYAVSRGYTMGTDPTAWKIVGKKLYLINNPGVLSVWTSDMDGNIALSEANWPGVLFD